MSNADRIRVSIVEETTFGVIPTSPAWQILETTGQTMRDRMGYQESQTIRNDRNVPDLIRLSKAAGGGLPIELRYGTEDEALDLLLAAVMCQSSWTILSQVASCTTTAAAKTITRASGSFVTDEIEVGDIINTSGATPAGDNGYFRVTNVTALTLTVAADANFTGSSGNVLVTRGARLKNGTAERSFSVEVARLDKQIAQVFSGCTVDTVDFNVSDGAITTANISLQGASSTRYTSNNGTTDEFGTGSTYGSATVAPVLDSIAVPEVRSGGATAAVKSVQMTLANNVVARTQVGAEGPQSMRYGRFTASGRLTAYLDDFSEIGAYADNTASDLWMAMIDVNRNGYSISFPELKYSDAGADTSGPNQDDLLELSATAILDATELCTVRLQRWDP